MKKHNVALIGLGPHAKRIYLNYFKHHKGKVDLTLVVDVKSKEQEIREYLDANNFNTTKIYTIDDENKDDKHLTKKESLCLIKICDTLKISHMLISTEPKAHNMYIEFALKNNINVLTDKPITVGKNMTNKNNIEQIKKDYYNILKLANESKAICKVMCQRQYHKGYIYVKNLLDEVVKKYQIPITYIDIYHCDGNWEMPHDLDKENHPYKYGYGKLFHSGYHFIDLLSDFIKINRQLPNSKKITTGEVFSNCFTPNDELGVFNTDDYLRIFNEQEIPQFYHENNKMNFKKYGEKNYYGMLKLKNSYNQTITNVNLNLLHYGFSRRGWIKSKDYYKKNGRIRHERINIQVGPLLNIQIHSYQSKEIKDITNEEEMVGGLEHYDIDIYRNVDIIGGKPFERIKLGDLYTEKEKKNMLGYNELSRDMFLNNFFNNKCEKGDIKDQALAIEILKNCALGISNHYNNKEKVEKFSLDNQYIYPITIDDLKNYSNPILKNEDKDVKNYISIRGNDFNYGVNLNYIKNKGIYEIYAFVESESKIASNLFGKSCKYKLGAIIYFILLKNIIKLTNIRLIYKLLNKKTLHKK